MWKAGYAQTNTTHTQDSMGPAIICASGDGSQDLVQARQVFCHGEVPGALGTSPHGPGHAPGMWTCACQHFSPDKCQLEAPVLVPAAPIVIRHPFKSQQ